MPGATSATHCVQLHVADMAAALPELDGTVDLVIANPPYIPLEASIGRRRRPRP